MLKLKASSNFDSRTRSHASITKRIMCMQGNGRPSSGYGQAASQQPLQQPSSQQQQPFSPQQQQQSQQQPPVSLARRSSSSAPARQLVFLNMTQVVNKQVITSSSASSLGYFSNVSVDTRRWEVVSFDLHDKKGVGSVKVASVLLSALKQVGDVILVLDATAASRNSFDGYDCMDIIGLEVRTRYGELLGKVRDFQFSPDNGAITSIIYDDFGKSWVPISFFDCYAISADCIESMGPTGIVVTSDARSRVWKESSGLLANIPSLLRSVSIGQQGSQGALGPGSSLITANGYRSNSYSMPQDYTYNQWETDIQRWEQETGLKYEQYVQNQRMLTNGGGSGYSTNSYENNNQQRPGPQRPALAAGRSRNVPASQPMQQQQPQYRGQSQAPADPRIRGPPPLSQQQQQQPPQQQQSQQQQQQRSPQQQPQSLRLPQVGRGMDGPMDPLQASSPQYNTPQTAAYPAPQPSQQRMQPQAPNTQYGQQGQQQYPQSSPAAPSTSRTAYPQSAAGAGTSPDSGPRRMDQWIEQEDPQQRRQLQELTPAAERAAPASLNAFPESAPAVEGSSDGVARRQQ